ncbi:MAG: PGPGW domain-containing protein [Pseudomonadota bacterium]
MDAVLHWIGSNEVLLAWLGVGSALVFIVSLATVPWFVARIPTDYFHSERRRVLPWARHHPAVRWPLLVLKNTAGILFLAAGIAMLVLPGQGLLTMLAGIILLDFPGKYRFERGLIRQPAILDSINWLRRRRGRPPLQL